MEEVFYFGYTTAAEMDALDAAQDPPLLPAFWIQESFSLACSIGVIKVPPPICSRLYQEVSNGLDEFHSAKRIINIPFSFPFMQVLALFLAALTFIFPLVAWAVTKSQFWTPAITVVASVAYNSLAAICAELDNPFGEDANDLPVTETHDRFLDALQDIYLAGSVDVGCVDMLGTRPPPAVTPPPAP